MGGDVRNVEFLRYGQSLLDLSNSLHIHLVVRRGGQSCARGGLGGIEKQEVSRTIEGLIASRLCGLGCKSDIFEILAGLRARSGQSRPWSVRSDHWKLDSEGPEHGATACRNNRTLPSRKQKGLLKWKLSAATPASAGHPVMTILVTNVVYA